SAPAPPRRGALARALGGRWRVRTTFAPPQPPPRLSMVPARKALFQPPLRLLASASNLRHLPAEPRHRGNPPILILWLRLQARSGLVNLSPVVKRGRMVRQSSRRVTARSPAHRLRELAARTRSPFPNPFVIAQGVPHASATPRQTGVHADRAAGRHRHHRHPDRPARPRRAEGARGGRPRPVPEQPQAARPGP